jgi:hypothetical protein
MPQTLLDLACSKVAILLLSRLIHGSARGKDRRGVLERLTARHLERDPLVMFIQSSAMSLKAVVKASRPWR